MCEKAVTTLYRMLGAETGAARLRRCTRSQILHTKITKIPAVQQYLGAFAESNALAVCFVSPHYVAQVALLQEVVNSFSAEADSASSPQTLSKSACIFGSGSKKKGKRGMYSIESSKMQQVWSSPCSFLC